MICLWSASAVLQAMLSVRQGAPRCASQSGIGVIATQLNVVGRGGVTAESENQAESQSGDGQLIHALEDRRQYGKFHFFTAAIPNTVNSATPGVILCGHPRTTKRARVPEFGVTSR